MLLGLGCPDTSHMAPLPDYANMTDQGDDGLESGDEQIPDLVSSERPDQPPRVASRDSNTSFGWLMYALPIIPISVLLAVWAFRRKSQSAGDEEMDDPQTKTDEEALLVTELAEDLDEEDAILLEPISSVSVTSGDQDISDFESSSPDSGFEPDEIQLDRVPPEVPAAAQPHDTNADLFEQKHAVSAQQLSRVEAWKNQLLEKLEFVLERNEKLKQKLREKLGLISKLQEKLDFVTDRNEKLKAKLREKLEIIDELKRSAAAVEESTNSEENGDDPDPAIPPVNLPVQPIDDDVQQSQDIA